jgi:tRNA (cytidine/uridine-2'-O-)-methyltransferase
MFSLILYQPEIPPNTGNIIRLCANTGTALHLIRPLGFELDEPRLKRAGLDYREFADIEVHESPDDCLGRTVPRKVYALSTRAVTNYSRPLFAEGDAFVFGPETRGLPGDILDSLPPGQRLRIPMQKGVRSLNLSNAAAVVVYEAWRQQGFETGE